MDNWMELQRFYEMWCKERDFFSKNENREYTLGFTSLDNKHHIFMYQTNEYTDDGGYEWCIEVNKIINGDNEPINMTFAPITDEACLMVQIAWCISKYWNIS